LEEPRVGIVVASDLEVDEHAAAQECSAMLESLLSRTRRNSKCGETEALEHL
jgi:hypothetical protein